MNRSLPTTAGLNTGQLADPARAGVALELHLPPAILGVHVTLGVEQVVDAAGVDVRDARLVADDFDGRVEIGQVDQAIVFGQHPAQVEGQQSAQAQDDGEHNT
jgi:hypothetical protein